MAVKKIQEPKVLIIGLGGGCLTNYLDARYPDVSLTSVEIDPDMVKVARVHFNLSESCKVVVGDGLKFLEENKEEKYDLIIFSEMEKYLYGHVKKFIEEEGKMIIYHTRILIYQDKNGLKLIFHTLLSMDIFIEMDIVYH